MAGVRLKNNETFDTLLRRFSRAVQKANIMKDLKKKQFYIKRGERKKKNG
tara:strand:- start:391 stop:540 length:150 start_codon:yes stop_codon:yes gene_type:complete